MKNYIIILLLITIVPSLYSWEIKKNPDRYPSIGFNYSGIKADGNIKIRNTFLEQDVKYLEDHLAIDLRLPVTHNLTLNWGLSYFSSITTTSENPFLSSLYKDSQGKGFSFNVRWYLK